MFYKPIDIKKEDIDNRDKIKFIPDEFTCWDFIEIKESLTIQKFIIYIKEKYNVDINSINSCNLNIYDSNKENNNIIKKIEDVYNEISTIKLFDNKKFLVLEIFGKYNNLEAKMPKIKYIFK